MTETLVRRSRPVELTGLTDNAGIRPDERRDTGGFNIWSNTFPAGSLPPAGGTVQVAGVPFRFPISAPGDNLRCRGQRIEVTPGRYDWIYLLAAAERRSEDQIVLHHTDGTRTRQWLRVSDFWPQTDARFGELLAYRCDRLLYPRHVQTNMHPSIWCCRTGISSATPVTVLELPDNPAIHLFALTMVTDDEGDR